MSSMECDAKITNSKIKYDIGNLYLNNCMEANFGLNITPKKRPSLV